MPKQPQHLVGGIGLGAVALLRECGGLDAGQTEFSQRLRAHLQATRTPA